MRTICIAFLLLFVTAASAQTNLPKNVKPFVRVGHEVVIEVYDSPTISGGEVKDPGTLVNKIVRKIPMYGSGTIISPDGLILTNKHVYNAEDMQYDKESNRLIKMRSVNNELLIYQLADGDPLKRPVLKYRAIAVGFNNSRDIALLKIIKDGDGKPLTNAKFDFVKLANPYALPINSDITCIGYPGKGGETVTITDGKFLGYTYGAPDAIDGSIKTSAAISGGNSGGTTLYKDALVAIPTRTAVTDDRGFRFGYLHPISWAVGPLVKAKVKYNYQAPIVDKAWLTSDYNTDETKTNLFVTGTASGAKTSKGVEEGTVLVYRSDRTLEQTQDLIKEVKQFFKVVEVQQLRQRGMSVKELARRYNTTDKVIEKVLKMTLDDFSEDAQKYLKDEAYYFSLAETDKDGFFMASVPRNAKLKLFMAKDGFRDMNKDIATKDGIYQELGKYSMVEF